MHKVVDLFGLLFVVVGGAALYLVFVEQQGSDTIVMIGGLFLGFGVLCFAAASTMRTNENTLDEIKGMSQRIDALHRTIALTNPMDNAGQ